jgi:hypothetical protein
MVSLEFFSDINLPVALWPWGRHFLWQKWVTGVFPGGKGGRCVRLTNLPPSCTVFMKSGNLNFLEPCGPPRPVTEPLYTGCPGRNVKNFGRVFLMLKYTDITQNTYIQSSTVTEIMAREKCGLSWGRHTVATSWQPQRARPSVWYRLTSRALSLTCIPSGW